MKPKRQLSDAEHAEALAKLKAAYERLGTLGAVSQEFGITASTLSLYLRGEAFIGRIVYLRIMGASGSAAASDLHAKLDAITEELRDISRALAKLAKLMEDGDSR